MASGLLRRNNMVTSALLRMAKCDDVQGYLMSKPLAPVEFAEWAGRTPHQLCKTTAVTR
jgi:hypothetical protein